MKLLKIGIRLTGILVTTAVLLSAVSLISRRAEKNFEKSGAYTSDLLVWEQEYPGEGRLLILGYPVRVDLERLTRLGEDFRELMSKYVSGFSKRLTEPSGAVRDEIAESGNSTCQP